MGITLSLILLLTFSLPAVFQTYVFQYFSRIRRPIEENPALSISALLLGAVFVHSTTFVVIDITNSGNLNELSNFLLDRLLNGSQSYQESVETQAVYQNPIEFLSDLIQYTASAMVIAAVGGVIFARFAAYGLIPFDLIGRLYYGGLYATFRGFLSRDVFVSVVSSNEIDNKTILYNGTLEELKLKSSGAIEYVTISRPRKTTIQYIDQEKNIRALDDRAIGEKPDPLNGEAIIIKQGRMVIEGGEIYNIYFTKQDFRDTFESAIWNIIRPYVTFEIFDEKYIVERALIAILLFLIGVISFSVFVLARI
jgi:hypothetical protein